MNIYSIPAGIDFLRYLARGTLDMAAERNIPLSDFTILLPNRRTCRALQEHYLAETKGSALILPRITPVADIDEEELLLQGQDTERLKQPLPPLRRTALLSRKITDWYREQKQTELMPQQSWLLAEALGDLLDQIYIEGLDINAILTLAPDDYAQHWQEVVEFLSILARYWPEQLHQLQAEDARARNLELLRQQARFWQQHPSPKPVIAAGSTGSIRANAELMKAVAAMPLGCVVLPALDRYLDDESWDAVDITHPQYYLSRFLKICGVERKTVKTWPYLTIASPLSPREELWAEVMRPVETTDQWQNLKLHAKQIDGIHMIGCASSEQEAGIISILMREALEDSDKIVALVTPDRNLARRVAAEMRRWNVTVDDSAGFPLDGTPVGRFLQLLARLVAGRYQPSTLLSVLKHPLCALGHKRAELRQLSQDFEKYFRNLRHFYYDPARGLQQYIQVAPEGPMQTMLRRLQESCANLESLRFGALPDIITAHLQFAELCAATDEQPGSIAAWEHDDGEAAAELFSELLSHTNDFTRIELSHYPDMLQLWLQRKILRHKYEAHPRARIWGLLESRLQYADRIILSGLNEGTWPPAADGDPWMSRPMRAEFGLPSRERRIGQSAYDFTGLVTQPAEIYLTRSARIESQPAIPSRWWTRLETLLGAQGLTPVATQKSAALTALQRELDRPQESIFIDPPAPTPPVSARPRTFSVTAVGDWMRNPYGFYAKYILHLEPLPDFGQGLNNAARGSLLHSVLEEFIRAFQPDKHKSGQDLMQSLLSDKLAPWQNDPAISTIWMPRFSRMADWFLRTESERRKSIKQSWIELRGEIRLHINDHSYALSAKADRIDLAGDGGLHIIDYKTGQTPSQKQIDYGFAPQLPLEAAIFGLGGFQGLPKTSIGRLEFWQLNAGRKGSKIAAVKGDAEKLAAESLDGLKNLIAKYQHQSQAYIVEPHGERHNPYDDYRHLSRLAEWGGTEDEA